MRLNLPSALALAIALGSPPAAANSVSGSVVVQKLGTIAPKFASAYLVRDRRNARTTRTEVLLTDVAVDGASIQTAFDPHMAAINVPALRDRNYVLLWVGAEEVTMNATFSKTMTQFLNGSDDGLTVTWTTKTAARLEGRVFSAKPLKTMDGTSYTVDLKFAVDVPAPTAGPVLPTGGGEAGKALTALVAAAANKDWPGIKAASSAAALEMFDKSYNTSAENASDAADLLKAWLPLEKMTVARGQLQGDAAVLDVEGDMFGQMGLSIVRMVKEGGVWKFDRAARAGFVK